MEFLFTSTNLLLLWIFAGATCFIPLIIKNQSFKYVVVVIVLSVVYTTFIINKEFIGRARYDALVDDFFYKDHSIATIDGKKYITMWIHDGKDDMLIRFLYTENKQKKLLEARNRTRKGVLQKGGLKKKPNKNIFKRGQYDLIMYDFPFQKQFPKD